MSSILDIPLFIDSSIVQYSEGYYSLFITCPFPTFILPLPSFLLLPLPLPCPCPFLPPLPPFIFLWMVGSGSVYPFAFLAFLFLPCPYACPLALFLIALYPYLALPCLAPLPAFLCPSLCLALPSCIWSCLCLTSFCPYAWVNSGRTGTFYYCNLSPSPFIPNPRIETFPLLLSFPIPYSLPFYSPFPIPSPFPKMSWNRIIPAGLIIPFSGFPIPGLEKVEKVGINDHWRISLNPNLLI